MFSSSRKKSKQKSSQDHPSSSRKPAKEEESRSTATATSFLFTVAELRVNEDVNNGGIAPRSNDDGRWIPPVHSHGFYPANPRQIYRWREGVISDYGRGRLYDGAFQMDTTGIALDEHSASSTFWCNRFVRFLTSTGDASRRNIELDEEPHHRWWALNFRYDGTTSRVDEVGNQYLTGSGPAWIEDLGLNAYSNTDPYAPPAGGLSGNLAILIGIIAFTCQANRLYDVLVRDHAWRRNHWRGGASLGREPERGLLVTIYYDPTNEQGSNERTLNFLEWDREEPLIH